MALRTQKQVMVGLDKLAGRALGGTAKRYDREALGPVRAALRKAKNPEGALRALSAALFRRMKTAGLEEGLEKTSAGAAGVGVTSAAPRKKQ